MTDITIEADEFGRTLEQLLGKMQAGVESRMPKAVEMALDKGKASWKTHARAVLSKSYSRGGWGKVRSYELYKSGKKKGQIKKTLWYGRTYKTGRYANSINYHMLESGGQLTTGEIGSPSMPGLAHLLEKGHASIGGGSVPAYVHIEPASEDAFKDFDKLVDAAVEEAINDT